MATEEKERQTLSGGLHDGDAGPGPGVPEMFAALVEEDEGDGGVGEENVPPVSEETPPTAPGEETPPHAIPGAVPEAAPVPTPAAAPATERREAVTPTPTGPSPAPPEPSPVEWRKAAEENLAKYYGLSEEASMALLENPGQEVPKLLARVYVDAVEGTSQALAAHLPALMYRERERVKASEAAEDEFYRVWPGLKDRNDLREELVRTSEMYVRINPDHSLEQTIKGVGTFMHLKHKIPLDGEIGKPVEAPRRKVSPTVPVGGVAPVERRKATGMFESLAEEILEAGEV